MSEFAYDLNVEVQPAEQARRGEQVTIFANVSNSSEQIRNVVFTVPEQGIYLTFQNVSEGRYRLHFNIPHDAPSGSYLPRVHATNSLGQKGTVVSVPYRVQ